MVEIDPRILSKAVKAITPKEDRPKETQIRGTIVYRNEEQFVRLDGASDSALTPITDVAEGATDAGFVHGDRVLVLLKDHQAIVIKNLTTGLQAQAAKEAGAFVTTITDEGITAQRIIANDTFTNTLRANHIKADDIIAGMAIIDELDTNYAHITNGVIDNAKIGVADVNDLNANYAHITNGVIDNAKIDQADVNDLNANYAHISNGVIDNAKIDQADVNDLNANYAHISNGVIDNAKIDQADVNGLNANYAHISNGTIDNAKINYADVNNLSANYAQINLANVNNAWIENGVVKDAAISDAQIIGVSANKLTAGTIDASNITVTNLNASNITTGSITVDGITIDVENNEASIDGGYIEDGTITMNGFAQEVKDVIDGAIETFTGTVVPTLNNTPANAWTTTKLKDQHIGDVYYVVNASSKQNGYCYRFSKSGSTYSWQLIKDSDVTAALQRLQTAEGKISNIESFDEEMATFKTETEGEISTLQTKTTSLETSLGDKVDKSTFNEVKQTVDGNSASITELSTITTNNGLTKTTNITNTVNTVSQTATGNSSKISSLTNTLGTNADGTTKAGDIVHRTSAVEQDLSGFKTTVSKTYHKTSDFNTYKAANDTAVAAAKKAGDDAQADLDEYKGTVSETYATKSSLTQTAEGIRTDVSSTYETKTDASAKLTEAKGDATTKANKALTDAKADTTNKLKSYYTKTQTDSAITQKAGEISLSVAQTEISKIEVGGRNLLKNSNDGSKYSWSQNNGAHSKTVDESGATFTITELPVSGSWGVFMVSDASLRTNILAKETYTLSFDIKTSVVISDISFGFNVREGNGANPFLNDHMVVVSTTANTWVHIVNTTTARDTLPSNSNLNLYITAPKLKNQLCSFSIKNVKVEKGNKATDWTPAPEDLENYADGAVNTAKAEIKVTTDSISTEVSKKVGNNEVISKINQSPEEITIDASRVNIAGAAIFSNYATTAQLNSEVNARKAVYATSSTAAGTKAKVADCSNFALYTGASVAVTFSNANTHATPTLNVNGTGAKNIKGYTGAALTEAEYKWIANSTVTFTYDGTNWRMQDGGALQAKAAAAASASIASTKASEASTSATNAATSASTASSKASEASTSATNAASSASTASSKASSASTSATNAATSASTASTKASEASTSATNAATSASTASTKASEAATSATAAAEVMGGFTILWNYKNFSTANNGEGYICAFDPKTGSKSDANGWVKWNGTKRTISKQMINPNTILPYNIPIYVVCRLSSATATTGTNYLVWYKSGWKYAALPTPTAVGGDWTWTEATDIILGKFAEPSSEEAFTDCEIYNPPRSSKHITTNTVTAGSAQATANAAAPKSSAVAEEQYIYISQASGTASVSANTTWVTETGDKQNTWTTKRPTYNTTYPVLFIAKQKKVVSGTVTCTTPVKDDTTTVIDGGHISTGTIDASKATITNINASNIKSGTLDAARIAAGAITVEKIDPIVYKYSNGGRGTGYAKLCTISVTENYRNKPIQFTLHSRNKNATAVSWRFLNSNSPSTCTVSSATYDGDTPLYYVGTGGTYTIYFALGESYDEVRIYDLIIPYDTGLTVAWAGEYYGTSLPSGAVAFTKLAGTRTSAELDNAAKTATTYITHIDNNGIRIHPASTENNSAVINADGLEIFKGGTTKAYSVAKYGDTARIGKESGSHLTLSPDSMSMSTGTNDVFNLLQKTMYIYWTRNYKGRQFANSTDRHVDAWETGTTISTWDSIAVNYKLNNTSRTKKITSISNGVLANDEIYVHFNYSGTIITLTYGRGSSAASSDIIKLESAVVYYVTDEKLSQLHTGTYPNTTVSGALRIGNGTSDSNRINLMLVDWSGTGKFKGDILAFCGADSSGGMSLTKTEENLEVCTQSNSKGAVTIDSYRVGRMVVLRIHMKLAGTTAAGQRINTISLAGKHLPKPLGNVAMSASYYGTHAIGLALTYNSSASRYELGIHNASSTAFTPASGYDLWGTLTYICDMDQVSGAIQYVDD